MPDMSSYNTAVPSSLSLSSSFDNNPNNNDEEYKRKKRLARNRASARLRRLKKKNLVDSYEGEVGILESALEKLKIHHWGVVPSSSSSPEGDVYSTENLQQQKQQHEGLIEALSMERGQAPLTPDGRRQLIQSILAQQKEQVENLLEVQLENWILCTSFMGGGLAATTSTDGGDMTRISNSSSSNNIVDEEMTRVASELQSLLRLTPQQISLMEQQQYVPFSSSSSSFPSSSSSVMNEIQDLFSVMDCLQSIHSNMWLLDEGVEELSSQLTSILNPTQLSKFLLWSDHNAEAIEKLDFVNVLPVNGDDGSEKDRGGEGPVFEFGVDEGLVEGD